jgi:hypothetical protein
MQLRKSLTVPKNRSIAQVDDLTSQGKKGCAAWVRYADCFKDHKFLILGRGNAPIETTQGKTLSVANNFNSKERLHLRHSFSARTIKDLVNFSSTLELLRQG